MTIYDETIEAYTQDPEIKFLYGSLSAGDLSILASLLENDAGAGTTIVGSPNAKFWHCLSDYGWMAKLDALLPDAPFQMQNYRVTDRGYRAIPVLLSRLAQLEC